MRVEEVNMNSMHGNREYAAQVLKARGADCPIKYLKMLAQTPVHRVIKDLDPWVFDHDPESAVEFCSEAAGREVLPFARAAGEDMMACFVPAQSGEPAILVIDPWAHDSAHIIQAELPNYDAWLAYAAEVSRQVQAREAEEKDGDD